MTTVAQVKQALQPLLSRNPDLALVGRFLFVKPVRHILRGVFVDRSSNSAIFKPKWAVVFTFEPDAYVSFNWGADIYKIGPASGTLPILKRRP